MGNLLDGTVISDFLKKSTKSDDESLDENSEIFEESELDEKSAAKSLDENSEFEEDSKNEFFDRNSEFTEDSEDEIFDNATESLWTLITIQS